MFVLGEAFGGVRASFLDWAAGRTLLWGQCKGTPVGLCRASRAGGKKFSISNISGQYLKPSFLIFFPQFFSKQQCLRIDVLYLWEPKVPAPPPITGQLRISVKQIPKNSLLGFLSDLPQVPSSLPSAAAMQSVALWELSLHQRSGDLKNLMLEDTTVQVLPSCQSSSSFGEPFCPAREKNIPPSPSFYEVIFQSVFYIFPMCFLPFSNEFLPFSNVFLPFTLSLSLGVFRGAVPSLGHQGKLHQVTC